MKDFRMQDIPWDFSEDDIAKMFPGLPPEHRAKAAENYSGYLSVIAKIYDRLKAEGKWDEVKLRINYEKRNRNKHESQNEIPNSEEKRRHLNPHRGIERIHLLIMRWFPQTYF